MDRTVLDTRATAEARLELPIAMELCCQPALSTRRIRQATRLPLKPDEGGRKYRSLSKLKAFKHVPGCVLDGSCSRTEALAVLGF